MKWKVGQKVWLVYSDSRRGDPHWETVAKVGRKWAYLGERHNSFRIDCDGIIDGGDYNSPGKCYESREEYENELLLRQEFKALREGIYYYPNKGVTIEDVRAAKKLLRI